MNHCPATVTDADSAGTRACCGSCQLREEAGRCGDYCSAVQPSAVDGDHGMNYLSSLAPPSCLHSSRLADACSQSEYSYLVSGSRDKTVKLWDPLKNTCLATFTCHDNWVRSVLLHPNGKYIISCSDDKSIRVVDIKVGTDQPFGSLFLIPNHLVVTFRRRGASVPSRRPTTTS